MRAIWSGALSFGLVNIPVKIYSAVDSTRLDFNMLHAEDLSPIRYARVCRAEGEEIPYDQIVKGYEYQKGDYVVLTGEDFDKVDLRKTRTIDIFDFFDKKEIDTIYFDKPYYLEPQKGAEKPYALLREALKESKKIGLARYVIRNREHIGVVQPQDKAIILEQIRFEDEIRPTEELKLPGNELAEGKEIEMALALINQLAGKFEPEKYHDTYIDGLKDIIAEKAKGRTPVARGKPPQPTEVRNLMEMLRRSLEDAKRK